MGADLQALTKEAASICINRIFSLLMEQDDMEEELEARKNVSDFLSRHSPKVQYEDNVTLGTIFLSNKFFSKIWQPIIFNDHFEAKVLSVNKG